MADNRDANEINGGIAPAAGPQGLDATIHELVRQALQAIDVDKKDQTLAVLNIILMDSANARYVVDFLQRYPDAVNNLQLSIIQTFTPEVVEIFRSFLTTASLEKLLLMGNLGNENAGRMLSGVHGNTSITRLILSSIGLNGAHISELLLNNSSVKLLLCEDISLGPDVRAMQPGLRLNQTLTTLSLENCRLGDEGISNIVDALEENTTIQVLSLENNHTTSNGLPHVTRLLQRQSSSLLFLTLDHNPELFHNEKNIAIFSSAISSQTATIRVLFLNFCQLSHCAITTIFQAVADNPKLISFHAYDSVQPQGQTLERLLTIIPNMNITRLRINLDFTDESVLSSFHRNSSIIHLHNGSEERVVEISNGLIFAKLDRNRRLHKATSLLLAEPHSTMMIPWGGVWAHGIEKLTRGNSTGVTAVYKIMRQKLVMWWAPMINPPPPAVAGIVSAAKKLHESTVGDDNGEKERKRSRLF